MNFSQLLANLLGTHVGSWGTPELGLTEAISDRRGIARDPLTGGSQNFAGGTNQVPRQTPPSNQPNGANDTSVNRALTGGGGGGTGGGTPTGGGQPAVDEVALAEAARRNRINSYKAQAGNIRSQAQGAFDNILKAVQAFRERAKAQFDTAGQEITNRASEILGSNARTARESAGEARSRGRALGLGDSSKFNLQNKVQGNLASTQGATVARRGEENRANQNLFQERQDQAQGQENEANTYLKNAMDRATTVENTGYDAGEEVFTNALNDIVNYQRQLAAIRPVQAEGLSQYAPNFSGIANTINGVLSGLGGGRGVSEEEMGNPVNPTNVFDLLRRRGLVQG